MKLYGANALICRDGLILAVARRNNPNDFSLPGGKIDPGETPEEACIREVFEETGLKISNLKEVYRGKCDENIAVSYTCDYTGEPATQPGEPECKWVHANVLRECCFGSYNQKLFEIMAIK